MNSGSIFLIEKRVGGMVGSVAHVANIRIPNLFLMCLTD